MKKISVLTAALTLTTLFPQTAVSAADNVRQHNNIVLFAQFDDVSETNFMSDRAEKIDLLCNGKDTFHSLNGYVKEISYGKMNVTSYFPQLKDGVITPYRLSGRREDYANCDQYAIEMISNISIPEDIPLDGDSDGVVDNIVLIVDGKATEANDPLWAKAFSVAGMKVNGLDACTVNMHSSYQVFENELTGAEGVLCHEFLHTIGYPDLYRSGRTGMPVGLWDIMASNSVFVQYPLAYQRAAVSGWLDYSEITESGTYTLSPVSARSGNRLYLLKTPLSDTEFFAVEYRQQGAKYSGEMDVKIYGTGLCVYRVNTEVNGNFKEERDGIYVFRPNETGLDAAEGDIAHSNFGGPNAPDHVGSLDWNDGISDGALVYSNGTNSGIMLSDITISGDKLTFRADFADRADVNLWESIDTSAMKSNDPYDITVDDNGTVWVAASDYFSVQVYKLGDDGLTAVGPPISTAGMSSPKIEICGGVPYVMYRDRNYNMQLSRLDTSGSWEKIYSGTETAQYADMTTDGKNIYLAYTEGSYPCRLTAAIYFTETGKFANIGWPNRENVCNVSIACCGDEIAIGYRSITNDNKPQVSTFPKRDSGKWNTYRFSDKECSGVSVSSDGEKVLVTPWGQGCGAYIYSGGEVISLDLPAEITENAFTQIPAMIGGKPCVAVNSQEPDELALYVLDGGNWAQAGDTIAREIVNELALAGCGDDIYCSCFTTNSTPMIKHLTLGTSEKVRGDVNADGIFSVADLIALSRYLMGSGDIADHNAADMCADGTIDVFDIVQMRKELV